MTIIWDNQDTSTLLVKPALFKFPDKTGFCHINDKGQKVRAAGHNGEGAPSQKAALKQKKTKKNPKRYWVWTRIRRSSLLSSLEGKRLTGRKCSSSNILTLSHDNYFPQITDV